MRFYRCQNARCSEDPHGRLMFDFAADEPICPKCKVDGRKYPNIVIPLVCLHYTAPHEQIDGYCQDHPACDPNRKLGTFRGTQSSSVVNCPKCKETEAWKKADTVFHGPPADQDFPIDEEYVKTITAK